MSDVRNIDIETGQAMAPDFLVARDGQAYGAELLLRRADTGRFFGWLAYTLSWSQRYDDNGVLGRSDWDERHILNLVAGYRLGAQLHPRHTVPSQHRAVGAGHRRRGRVPGAPDLLPD